MGEIKPLGSEKLKGDAKLKRILELTYFQSPTDAPKSTEIVKESKSGIYGIVKEKDGYYVKKGLNESSLDYIGGLFMKNKNRFNSYGEALKKLEFLTEQEELQEAVRYTLKQPKPAPAPQAEAPMPEPTGETPPPMAAPDETSLDAPEAGAPPVPGDEMGDEVPDAGGENPEEYMNIIQKYTGKLTQKLNTYRDKMKSEDIKYVVNMVLGNVDLDVLEPEDEDEILEKFEDEENPEETGPDFSAEEPTGEAPSAEAPPSEDDLGETDGMNALEELINTPFEDADSVFNDDEEDEIDSPDISYYEDKKASRFAQDDFEKENEGMNDDEEDMESMGSPLDLDPEDMDPEADDVVNPEEEEDNVRELDIDELTQMVNDTVKGSLSKYFS
jgi:hypothetical protein